MPEQARLYDLMLVLSNTAEDERRAKILSDVEAQITNGGGADRAQRRLAQPPAGLRDQPPGRGRVPPVPVHRADVAARGPLAQPAHRRRGAALPDHQGGAGNASGARLASPGGGGAARPPVRLRRALRRAPSVRAPDPLAPVAVGPWPTTPRDAARCVTKASRSARRVPTRQRFRQIPLTRPGCRLARP